MAKRIEHIIKLASQRLLRTAPVHGMPTALMTDPQKDERAEHFSMVRVLERASHYEERPSPKPDMCWDFDGNMYPNETRSQRRRRRLVQFDTVN